MSCLNGKLIERLAKSNLKASSDWKRSCNSTTESCNTELGKAVEDQNK